MSDLARLLGIWTWRPQEGMYTHVSGELHVFQWVGSTYWEVCSSRSIPDELWFGKWTTKEEAFAAAEAWLESK